MIVMIVCKYGPKAIIYQIVPRTFLVFSQEFSSFESKETFDWLNQLAYFSQIIWSLWETCIFMTDIETRCCDIDKTVTIKLSNN